MTQHINRPDKLSNWFDLQLAGIGHRGSSFTDIDGLVHDERTDRFLVMEFKWDGAGIPDGQLRALRALARKADFTVWGLKRLADDHVKAYDIASGQIAVIDVSQLRRWFTAWWAGMPIPLRELMNPGDVGYEEFARAIDDIVQQARSGVGGIVTADEISWSVSRATEQPQARKVG